MFILNEYEGSRVSLDYHDGNLYQVLLHIADTARKDGFNIVVDQRIKGRITINLDEPWNLVLTEILAGLNVMTVIESNKIMISLAEWEM